MQCKVIAVVNQKGGVGKTTTTFNLGVGLARMGKRVALIDCDPQGDLTICCGYPNNDEIDTTIATLMKKIINDEEIEPDEGIIHQAEGVDLIPANIELSSMDLTLIILDCISKHKIGPCLAYGLKLVKHQRADFLWRKEKKMAKKGGVSSKTHTKQQLDNYANQHNPNNKAYKANKANTSKMRSSKKKERVDNVVDLEWFCYGWCDD